MENVAGKRKNKARRIVVILLAVVVAGGLGLGGWVLVSAQRAIDTATQGQGGSVIDVVVPQPIKTDTTATPGSGGALNDAERLNVLVAGNAADDPGHGGAELTDAIIVASVNLKTSKVALISVPRDLWVQYAGSSMKINAVYVAGGTGRSGLDALGQVVERVTGLHIDQHLLVGFGAVRDVVDTIGGIDVTISSPDPRGIRDGGVRLANGPQHLDGVTALALARARNDPFPGAVSYGLPQSDYSRQQSQRMILAAIVQRVKSTPTLANPITVVTLFNQVSSQVTTDLTVSQIRGLYDIATRSAEPTSATIRGESGHYLITDYLSASGADAQVPVAGVYDYSQIRAYVAHVVAA